MTLDFKSFKNHHKPSNLFIKKDYIHSKPNFVLVNGTGLNLLKKTDGIAYDITPFADKVDTSTNNHQKIHIISSFFSIFYSLLWIGFLVLSTSINSVLYILYQFIVFLLEQLLQLPTYTINIITSTFKKTQTLIFSDTRDLLLLNLKVDFRTYFNRGISTLNLLSIFVKKSYLSIIVFISLGMLSMGSNMTFDTTSKSFLSNFINKNTSISSSLNSITSPQKFNLLSINASASSIQIITEYELKNGDTLDKIALFYGVNKETLLINNEGLTNVTPGQKLFIPWVDGYIYKTSDDSSLEDVANLFNINKDEIYNENIAVFNPEINKFKKDTLILIPTKDFNQITKALENIKTKAETEKKRKEEENKRKEILQSQAVSSSSISGVGDYAVGPKSDYGFIWPTKGSISRCFSSYHTACDIANFSSPPIVAAGSGTVLATYHYDVVGYGLAVLIDHGNGVNTLYAHMREIDVVKGQQVATGQQIGVMGQTGMATGIHLHFEVRINNVKYDPLRFLP
jgi:murein DD-endopeptidase MepM/ murein hydrolase activator NlpD